MREARSRALLPSHKHEQGRFFTRYLLGLVLLLISSNLFWVWHYHTSPPLGATARGSPLSSAINSVDTLVVYSFRYSDSEALNNLAFFMEFGIQENDGARYIIVMDPTLAEQELPDLPDLPPNAERVPGPNCFEQGMGGWIIMSSKLVDVEDFRYFVFLSSSVVGPLLPAYNQDRWHRLFTKKITEEVKLVGSTISCTNLQIDVNLPPMQHPHVQSDVLATDKVGLAVLKRAGALDCHYRWLDNLRFAEFGSSGAILKAGYSLDSFLLRYQGVDWRDKRSWDCNAGMDPTRPHTYDGTSLNPLEVVFVRSNLPGLTVRDPVVLQAALYTEWLETRAPDQAANVTSNRWISEATRHKETVMALPPICFDRDFYVMASPVELQSFGQEEAYNHFRDFGHREGRPYRFLC